VPDWRLVKLLATLPSKNTDGLIGGVVKILAAEGIHLTDSTALLKPLLATSGAMTRRKPSKDEETDIAYGRRVADALAGFDVGQSVAICERACVALEAMEGTDAMLRRAAGLANGRRLTLVKVARRREHLLFDVPTVGADTIPVMRETALPCVSQAAISRRAMQDAVRRRAEPLMPHRAAPEETLSRRARQRRETTQTATRRGWRAMLNPATAQPAIRRVTRARRRRTPRRRRPYRPLPVGSCYPIRARRASAHRLGALERLIELYLTKGDSLKAEEYEKEFNVLSESDWSTSEDVPQPPPYSTVVRGKKTGRNESCPCGSGKKYKKCCGR